MSGPSWCIIGALVIILQQIAPTVSQDGPVELGKCPVPPVKPECPSPINVCSFDVECPRNQKCCDDGCSGSECREPVAGSGSGPTSTASSLISSTMVFLSRPLSPKDPLWESDILSGNTSYYGRLLKMWIGGNSTWKLCWRATRDGWAAKIFHSNCDHKQRTVTLVKVGQYIFGGYATASWEGFRRWRKAGGSFIFSLRNRENLSPFTAPLKDENTRHAIYADHRYGPIFGYGHDLYIADNSVSSTPSHSSTYFNTTYQPPSGVSEIIKILAGTFRFSPSQVEVFYLV